ncbi:hemerythrin domain-containing protein [Nocardioides terrisoli]|uniref:hemerythrin domain-containing protein n=1 Tax=Nocardioides terrisoli TaxID=3388267 RepID=UPI00287B8990|nr:hemerythrin domain-containing protein [Nocardioides marmorisolisilvae]
MSTAAEERARAAELPEGDVIRILLEQHARIRDLFAEVQSATDAQHKSETFDELRALLAMHETAEEMVLRPVSSQSAGKEVTDARNEEEAEANKVLVELEKLDVSSPDFDHQLAEFEKSVSDHAEAEETQEFPEVLSSADEKARVRMGTMLTTAEKTAPTHPHPSAAGSPTAQWIAGPFASLLDHAKDALQKAAS